MLQMRDALQRLRRLPKTPEGKKLIRYSMVSVVSTVVSQLSLFVIYGFILQHSAIWSNGLANAIATVPSYYLNRKWVWGKSGKSHVMKEIVPFWALSFAGLVLSTVAVAAAQTWVKHHLTSHHHLLATIIVMAANLLSYGILWVAKFMIFNRLFKHHPVHDAEVEAHLIEG